MFLMMLQVSLDDGLKYLFNFPIPATLETVSSYYIVALIFLPLGIVTRDHEHISVELFTQGLSERWLSLVNALAGSLAMIYIGVMTYRCAEEAVQKTLIGESWEKGAGFADDSRVDRWQEFEYVIPSTVVQWTGALEQ